MYFKAPNVFGKIGAHCLIGKTVTRLIQEGEEELEPQVFTSFGCLFSLRIQVIDKIHVLRATPLTLAS